MTTWIFKETPFEHLTKNCRDKQIFPTNGHLISKLSTFIYGNNKKKKGASSKLILKNPLIQL